VRPFQLLEPRSVDAALEALVNNPGAKLLAGGTALLILVKHGIYPADCLVNLRKVGGLTEIQWTESEGLRIGALASIRSVERHPSVRQHYPVLAQACHVVANVRIRNLATIGGNLAHADYQSDPPTALAALGAQIEVTGPSGVRRVPIADFLVGVYATVLQPDELLTAVFVPPANSASRAAYLKFTTRSSEDRPAAGVAVLVRLVDRRIEEAVVVLGAVTPTPVRLDGVERLLRGRSPDAAVLAEVGALTERVIDPIDDLRGSASYKRRISGALVERALRSVLGSETFA
jgi:carbon-monoxide dehydrogenase medium subunit